MTSREKFDQEVWWVLQKIRYISMSAPKGEPLEWVMQSRPTIRAEMLPIEVRQRMFLKIKEWGGLRIIKEESTHDTYGVDLIYTFELIQPKFDEVYEEYNSKQANQSAQEKDNYKKIEEKISEKRKPIKEDFFNYKEVRFSLNGKSYNPTDEKRKVLLRELWLKKQTKNKKGTMGGERIREAELAVLCKFIGREPEFNSWQTKNSFRGMIKELNRIFKRKSFPIIIDSDKKREVILIQTVE